MIYTFYSYKGGVGRSMALVNVAELMYRAGRKVIMVDWDLEAPGLEKFYPDLSDQVLMSPGIIDLLLSYKERAARYRPDSSDPLFSPDAVQSHLIDMHPDASAAGKLWLLPAGRRAGEQFVDYANRVKTFDWQDFYQNWEGEVYFEWLRRRLNDLADAVLIDSRTGVTEMGGVCAYQLADTVAMFCSANEQNMDGTLRMVKSFSDTRLPQLRHGRELQIIVVPSRIERLSETRTLNRFRKEFSKRFQQYMPEYFRNDPSALVNLEIPYVPYYAFEEIVAVSHQRKDERSVELESAYDQLFRALDLGGAAHPETKASSLTYLDFELHIGAAKEGAYPVAVVRSPAGEARSFVNPPLKSASWEIYVGDLRIALPRTRVAGSTENAEVRQVGSALFDALFSENVRSVFDTSRSLAESQGKGLRIMLHIQDPALAALPWEVMYDKRRQEFVSLSRLTPIVRFLELTQPDSPAITSLPLRILGVVASPNDTLALNIDAEKRRIEEALLDSQKRGLAELIWLEMPTWRNLQSTLRKGPWHTLHFIGHGYVDPATAEAGIVLVDEQRNASRLSGTQIGRLLGDQKSLRLIVLSSCETARDSRQEALFSVAATLVQRGLPAVLAIQQEISDRAAIEITRALYEALFEGYPIYAAVTEARKAVAIALGDSLEWSVPVLFMRTRGGLLFDLANQKPSLNMKHLTMQLNELHWQYDTLTKRLAALDTDITRA